MLPANVLAQTSLLIKLVMFDVLEFFDFWGTQTVLTFNEDVELGIID